MTETGPNVASIRRYRKKPVLIDAMRLLDDMSNADDIAAWVGSKALDELRNHKRMRTMALMVSAEEQAVIDHNRAKYAELEKLRAGQANRYAEMRYRS